MERRRKAWIPFPTTAEVLKFQFVPLDRSQNESFFRMVVDGSMGSALLRDPHSLPLITAAPLPASLKVSLYPLMSGSASSTPLCNLFFVSLPCASLPFVRSRGIAISLPLVGSAPSPLLLSVRALILGGDRAKEVIDVPL
jgi:hypothetical protein